MKNLVTTFSVVTGEVGSTIIAAMEARSHLPAEMQKECYLVFNDTKLRLSDYTTADDVFRAYMRSRET